jgi:thioredoxin-dependent peroxiredoxin
MVDPPKATKGRRMSKKSRKKTSKKTPKTTASKTVKTKSVVQAKTKKAKIPGAAVNKSGKTTAKTTTKTTAGQASHKAASKRLKFSDKASRPAAGKAGSTGDKKVDNTTTLVEGAEAPAFHLPRDGGGTVGLSDFSDRKLVLFFYPRADTPGCTREAIDFTRLSDAFADAGTAVLGISADSVKAQEKFRDKHKLSVPLISDERHDMLEAYGAWGEKSMYGKTFLGVIRTTVLIGADGRIAKVWRHVKVDGHAEAVLAAAQAL